MHAATTSPTDASPRASAAHTQLPHTPTPPPMPCGEPRSSRPAMPAQPPRPQRSYHIDSSAPRLGSGAFGAVYEGFEKTTKKPVAVKVIRKAKLSEEHLRATRRETAMMRKISQHPNVLQLLDESENERNIYIVMPLVDGGDLEDSIEAYVTEEDVRDVLRHVLSGIAHMHEHGVMHRDIKASNVLLHGAVPESTSALVPQHAPAPRPVLSDFGFATDAPRSNEFCGTPYYIAPEVIAAARDKTKQMTYDKKCDVWSFGVLAFVLLNDGAKPFVARTMRDCFDAILRNRPAWTDFCSPAARAFVEAVLITDPAKRPTAAELLQHPWLCPPPRAPFSSFDCDSFDGSSEPLTVVHASASTIGTVGMSMSSASLSACTPKAAACGANGTCVMGPLPPLPTK